MTTSRVCLYFNPGCSKCRGAKEILDQRGESTTVIRYLEERPHRADLEQLSRMLGISSPREMMRKGEPIYTELGLANASDDQLLDAIVAHPILLERPIVVRGNRAVIARPPDKLLGLFEDEGTA